MLSILPSLCMLQNHYELITIILISNNTWFTYFNSNLAREDNKDIWVIYIYLEKKMNQIIMLLPLYSTA